MRSAIAGIAAAALAIALASASAHAQGAGLGGGGGGGGHKHQEKSGKTDTTKPKADDKAYSAALKTIPNKEYDPWRGVTDNKTK